MAEPSVRERCEKRHAALKTLRSTWDGHCREVADFILPRKGRFQTTDRDRGGKLNQHLLDTTGTIAHRTLQSGLQAGITSPARPWFRLTIADKALMEWGPVKNWLYDVEQRMRLLFQASNVYNSLHTIYGELGLFGTAACAWLEDFNRGIIGAPMTFGEYWIACGPDSMADTLYRECSWSVSQVVDRFGLDACSTTVKALYDRYNYDAVVDICHAIEPNRDRDASRADSRNMATRSVYWEKGADADRVLSIRGFNEFPGSVPRWDVTGNDTYGRSPGMDALPDVKQLQQQQRRKAMGIDKIVNPPMVASGQLVNGAYSLLPGGVTVITGAQGAAGFQPAYQIQLNLNDLREDMAETRDRVRQAFYADIFLMIAQSDGRMTATEVTARREEKMLALGPVLERLQSELLSPLIDRTFAIMQRRDLIPPPPDELQGMALRVDYISILAQAQKALATSAVERVIGFVGSIAAGHPEALDKIDFDQTIDEYGDMTGVPPRIIRPDDQVARIRQDRARQQQAAQATALAAQGAQAAKVLSETDMRTPNALTNMLGIG